MVKEFKRQFFTNYKDYCLGFGIEIGVSLLVSVVFFIVGMVGQKTDFPLIGSLIFYFTAGLYGFILAVTHIGIQLNVVLKMGAVRRQYTLVSAVYLFIFIFISMLLGRVWHLLEVFFFSRFSLGNSEVNFQLPLTAILIISLSVTIAGIWFGALIARYGAKGFWVVWFFWIFSGLFGGKLTHLFEAPPANMLGTVIGSIKALFNNSFITGWLLGALALLAVILHSWWLLRKIPAKD